MAEEILTMKLKAMNVNVLWEKNMILRMVLPTASPINNT